VARYLARMTLNDNQRRALALIVPMIDASPAGLVDTTLLEDRIAAAIPRGSRGLAKMLLTQLGKKGAITFRWVGAGFRVELLPAGRAAAGPVDA
jgi:Rod binding domain-containing protein